MTTYIIRRLLMSIIVLLVITLIVFFLMRLIPGDPLLLFVNIEVNDVSPEMLDRLRQEYNLDKPLITQYLIWLRGILQGDIGRSMMFQRDVSDMIAQSLPVTVNIGIYALILSWILGIAFGTICAIRRGRWPDTLLSVTANLGITLPNFWVGILLIYFLSLKLDLLPTYGYTSPFDDLWLHIRMMIMPVICMSVFGIAALTRQTRSSMLEVTRQDYIRTAWAKGLKERAIVIRHVIKNGLIPVVTTMGIQVSFIFGGSILVESVFNIPGMGRMMADAAMAMDYQVVQGAVLFIGTVIIITNLLVDIVYGWLDPRIRYD